MPHVGYRIYSLACVNPVAETEYNLLLQYLLFPQESKRLTPEEIRDIECRRYLRSL